MVELKEIPLVCNTLPLHAPFFRGFFGEGFVGMSLQLIFKFLL